MKMLRSLDLVEKLFYLTLDLEVYVDVKWLSTDVHIPSSPTHSQCLALALLASSFSLSFQHSPSLPTFSPSIPAIPAIPEDHSVC